MYNELGIYILLTQFFMYIQLENVTRGRTLLLICSFHVCFLADHHAFGSPDGKFVMYACV